MQLSFKWSQKRLEPHCGSSSFFFFLVKHFFIYLFLFWAALGLRCRTQAFSSCSLQASRCGGSCCCGAWALAFCRIPWLWRLGSAVLGHVSFSWTEDQNRVPCSGRLILLTKTLHSSLEG